MPREPPAARLTGMNISAHAAAGTPSRYWGGLYSFKSWYASRLAPVRRVLVSANVPPTAITMAGVAFGGGAGAAPALLRPRPVAGAVVVGLLAAPPARAHLHRPRCRCPGGAPPRP